MSKVLFLSEREHTFVLQKVDIFYDRCRLQKDRSFLGNDMKNFSSVLMAEVKKKFYFFFLTCELSLINTWC